MGPTIGARPWAACLLAGDERIICCGGLGFEARIAWGYEGEACPIGRPCPFVFLCNAYNFTG